MTKLRAIAYVVLAACASVAAPGRAVAQDVQGAGDVEDPPATPATPPAALPGMPNNALLLPASVLKRGIGWDVELEGAIRLAQDGDAANLLMGRLQLGIILVREPLILSLGATGELGGIAGPAVGGQVNLTHFWRGAWAHAGGGVSFDDEVGAVVDAAVGWTLFGLEYQRSVGGDGGGRDALYLTLRVPIGIVFFMI
jgi:hypothetical protein